MPSSLYWTCRIPMHCLAVQYWAYIANGHFLVTIDSNNATIYTRLHEVLDVKMGETLAS